MKRSVMALRIAGALLFTTLFISPLSLRQLPASVTDQQPPPPCHPNTHAGQDVGTLAARDDIRFLPNPLKIRLFDLAARPHSVLPVQANAEADGPSQLFQYYLLDTH